ncbi:hypothetical protein TNCV_2768591 [Trichonephila clavipes]|nr:hypothetical protein TNCV_2768591 [Trichonephila clavipes]
MPLLGSEISKNRVSAETVSMLRVGNTRSLLGHSSIGSISAKKNSSWRASTHHGVQQGRQCAGHLANTRHGAYLEYTQNIMLQHQGEGPTGAGLLLPPVYSEAWAKGNAEVSLSHQSPPNGRSVGKGNAKDPRTQFSFLRDAAHGKHASWKANVVSQKQMKYNPNNQKLISYPENIPSVICLVPHGPNIPVSLPPTELQKISRNIRSQVD